MKGAAVVYANRIKELESALSESRKREGLIQAEADRLALELNAAIEREEEARRTLWLGHGCDIAALYGDDGEMQCNALHCFKDFRREPLSELIAHTFKLREQREEELTATLETVTAHATALTLREEIAKLKGEKPEPAEMGRNCTVDGGLCPQCRANVGR